MVILGLLIFDVGKNTKLTDLLFANFVNRK